MRNSPRERVADSQSETNARISLAISSASAGAWDLDLSTGRIWATQTTKRLYGFADNVEVTFDALLSVVHPEDVDRVKDGASRTAPGTEFADEFRVVLPGGTIRWIAVRGRGQPATDASGPHITGMSVEVTARKLAESEHRAYVARLQAALDAAGLGFYVMSDRGETSMLDDRARNLIGIPAGMESNIRSYWLEHVHPDDRNLVLQASHDVIDGGIEHLSRVYRYQHPTRGIVWIRHTTRTFERDASGHATRVAGVLQDITEQKRIEWEMQEHQATMEAAAELAGFGYCDVDLVEGRAFVDDRFRALCGVPPERAAGQQAMDFWKDHVHPEDQPRVFDLQRQLLSRKLEQISMEYRFLHPSRGERWFQHISAAVARDSSACPTRTIRVVRDITERKRAAQELGNLSRRLIQAHEAERSLLARDLHDDVTQRLAVLAIELGRIETTALGEMQSKTLTTVREGLIRLSEDIHALAYQLHPSVLEELGLVEALRTECERRGRRGGFDITRHLDAVPIPVGKDATLCLYRVAQEALNNVARHARAHTATVVLRQMDGGVLLAVTDDGVGFDPEEPRARRSLGLVSMRERLGLVNGTLDIESAPGRGTSIIAWVPAEGGPQ